MARIPAIGVDQLREVLAWSCLHHLALKTTQTMS